jgi:hypothetical protein
MRLRVLLVACAALALTVGTATATAGGGNSAAAKACQKDGWKNWVRENGSSFKNTGDCVSYVAQGGTLTPKTKSQLDCESFGGTFLLRPQFTVSWVCAGWLADTTGQYDARNAALGQDCSLEYGAYLSTFPQGTVPESYASRCSGEGA